MIRRKSLRRLLGISLSVMLILTMAPGVFAASNNGKIIESLADHPQLAAQKIDSELKKQFADDTYVTYLIKMVEQVDTEKVSKQAQALSKRETPAMQKLAMREAVVNSLRETAIHTQDGIIKYLEDMKERGAVKEYESFYIVNGLAITSTKEVMEKISLRPEVEKVLPNRTHTLDIIQKTEEKSLQGDQQLANIEWNIEQVGAPQVWEMGIDGTGIVVANMDTGVQLTHPALQRKWRGNDVADPALSWFDPFTNSTSPIDGHGHGTHVMGTMVGSEANGTNQVGVAPGAKWIAARIFDSSGSTTDARIIAGGEWILSPKDSQGNPHPEMAPDVVNNSWGNVAPGKDEWFRHIVQAWRSAGIFPEFSAGNTRPPTNNGGPGSITPPANYPESFATAATDINRNLASFSLRGPTPYGEMKPDISAPGVNIRSSVPGGGYEGGWNGTSMSGPHVSAAVALLLQANASLTIDDIERILRETATPLTNNEYPSSPNHGFGWGLLNVYDAVSAVVSGLGTVSGKVTVPGDDLESPVIEHTPITFAFSGMDIPITAQVSDNVSVVNVELFARKVGDPNFYKFDMNRVSGDYKDGIYESAIPAFLLTGEETEYYIRVNDYGNNQTETPTYTIEVSNGITPGYFQNFENDAFGFESGGTNNKWEWGVPTSGPGRAYSGDKLIATNLSGDYSSGSNSYMMMPPIDLTNTTDAAYLTFMHWYNFENNYDKGSVQIAGDDGEFVKVLEFTGDGQGWKKQFVDLTPFLGQQIRLLFNLNTDNSVTRPGWYIDDIALFGADEEPPAAPTNLSAQTDAIGNVTLTWDHVGEHDLKDYFIYRSSESGTGYEKVGESVTNSYRDALIDTGTYYYVVKARDYSNNLGEWSNEVAVLVTLPITIFFDNFNGDDDNGWTHGGTQDLWQRGVPTSGPRNAVLPPNVWATNLTGNYGNSSNNYLVSPVIDLKDVDNATLTFFHWYAIETNYDKGFVEITTNGGSTWSELAMFTHSTNGKAWNEVVINLDNYVGNDVQIRYRLTSDGSVAYEGWYIDGFRILSASAETDLGKDYIDQEENLTKPKAIDAPPEINLKRSEQVSSTDYKSDYSYGISALPIDATVTVLETGRSVNTDPSNGRYSFIHPAGEFTLRAEAYGFYPAEQSLSIVDDQITTANFALQPMPHGTITGLVADKRSLEPIAGARVMVVNNSRVAPVTTDHNGEFSFVVLEGEYTLSISADGYNTDKVTVTVDGDETTHVNVRLSPFIGYEDIIYYDDGTAENAIVFNISDAGFGVRMTPEFETTQIMGALFRFWDTSWPSPGGTAFKYAIYDASGPGGSPGQMIAGPFDGTAKRDGTWTEVSFPEAVTVQGDFYLVYLQVGLNPNAPGVALDESSQNAYRSWQYTNGAWSLLEEDYGNVMFRAIVKYPVDSPVITSPTNDSYTNEENITVTGLFKANGATINLFNGEELVGTDVVQDGQFSIDITLNVGENQLLAIGEVDGKLTDPSEVVQVVLDQNAPVLEVITPEDGFMTNQEVVHVSGSLFEENLDALYVNDEVAEVKADDTFNHRTLLNPGENLIMVRAVDKAGNETSVTRSVYAQFERAFELTDIQPAEDLYINAGETVNVSFNSIEGLEASFRIELDLGLDSNRSMMMSETFPGHYEGSWTTPSNLNIEKAIIVITAIDGFGNSVSVEAPGRLFVTQDNNPGIPQPEGPVNITVRESANPVQTNEAFTIDLDFSTVEDLYAVQFSLIYDAIHNKGTVSPSMELRAHQNAENSGVDMIKNEKVEELGNGKVRSDYLLSLAGDISGYSGEGSLATFNFASDVAGDFEFNISNVRFLDSNGKDIELGTLTPTTVRVIGGVHEYQISGNIVAEGFGNDVDYSETWYQGSDGVHKVVVEALDEDGKVVQIGTVSVDGSYRMMVPAGNYTIRVVVPSHFSTSTTVEVDNQNMTVNFGPLTAGDVNDDGVIDLVDLQQVAKAFGKLAPWTDVKSSAADINRDGEVDMLDISFILNNFGARK